jgi:cytochrome oxidase Cu insertion factor (SCO1/SenC/PrrC family)
VRRAALLCLLGLALCACGEDEPQPTRGPDGPGRAEQPVAKAERVYGRAPAFVLTDQDGKTFQSDRLFGKVWVATFFFTRCLATCPVQTKRLAELQTRLKEEPARADVRLLSITVDAEHDTPEVLKRYAEQSGADTSTWSFLTGERRYIWALSQKGFKLPTGEDPANAEMPIAHSARFVLVDRVGRFRGYYDSQSEEAVDELEDALRLVTAEPAPERLDYPADIAAPPWLEPRRKAQLEAAKAWGVRHDFAFTDQRRESEIGFVHRLVDDSGKLYKAVHYDHGNGVAVADVDGDGLLDLYFSNQVGSNQLWRNDGDGKFENITEEAGVAVKDAVGVTASFADIDNDGDPDLFVTTVHGGNRLYENDGEGTFKNITADAGLGYSGHSSAAVFFDYDKDGRLDLYLCNVGVYTTDTVAPVIEDSTTSGRERGSFEYRVGHLDGFTGHLKAERTEKSILYRNLGGNRFQNVSESVRLDDASWNGDATPVDANEDGWPDLYVLNMQGHDEYYENVGGKHFVRKSRQVFPRTPWGSMGVKVFDFDGDGLLDIYVTDMHSDMSEDVGPEREKLKSNMRWPASMVGDGTHSIWGNAFFRRTGPGRFQEVSDVIGAESYWPWGLSVGDLNADGFDDAFLASSMNYPFRYGVNSVLLNDGGRRFLDSEFVLGVEPRRGALARPWFDLDCADPADMKHRLCKGRSGRMVVWGALGSRSSVIFDLDGDGDLDIVTNDYNSEPLVLVSDLAQRHQVHYLNVRLVGSKSNRSGIGALVRMTAGGRTQVKVNDGQSGYLSQSDKPLYFGLGDVTTIEAVEVRWPSGTTQRVTKDLAPNRTLVVEEP